MNYQPYFNSTASNVLYGYWSHDLGGHIGNHIDPEMYIRWMQFGALSPIMRTHSQKSANMNKEPWSFSAEYCEILREIVRQRYEMAPYIYTMARKAYDEGLSLCRPLYYDYPECNEAYSFRNEYMFGDDMLIAPITTPANGDYSELKIWLPKGYWYELHTGTLLKGDQIINRYFAIDEYPIYIKAGSVLPMYSDEVMNLNNNDEDIVVTIFPGSNETKSFDKCLNFFHTFSKQLSESLTVRTAFSSGSFFSAKQKTQLYETQFTKLRFLSDTLPTDSNFYVNIHCYLLLTLAS